MAPVARYKRYGRPLEIDRLPKTEAAHQVLAAFARLLPSAVRVRITSRSTSASPPRTAIISRPVLVAESAHGSASERHCPPASTICLTMANRSNVERARRSIRVTITTSPEVSAFSSFSKARRS